MEEYETRFEATESSPREDVAAVQFALRKAARHGTRPYYAGEIDGRFGPRTRSAIASYQRDRRIAGERTGEVRRGGPTGRSLAMLAGGEIYTGLEARVALVESAGATAGAVFEVRPPNIPADATPIADDELTIVGYRSERHGLIEILDLDGEVVHRDELGLESPLFDPSLLIPAGGLAMLSLRKLLALATGRAAAGTTVRLGLGQEIERALFRALHSLRQTPLRFTNTTAAQMRDPGRHVPVHVLRMAIRHGRRAPDPRGVRGAIEYRIPMSRLGQRYELKIVLRERDNTILHFHYER
ncbi:peptidoglycan-binding domain-containing protein [Nisaea sediminum]|uniref:peptidoglycan-binding domain-containing protein n=1 Tax=Nisaea sediminum TaxID=2775867 RepID=UPI001865EE98|nr:peptidoglycan-binding protein [Nisaea sediminum]